MRKRHRCWVGTGTGLLVTAALGLAAAPSSARALGPRRSSAPAPRQGLEVFSFGAPGGYGKMRALEHDAPVVVSGVPGKVIEVATSNSDSYALTASGAVWAWGAGTFHQLGDRRVPKFVRDPVRVAFPPGVKVASLPNPMPYDSGLAIDTRGRLWVWGYNPAHALCLPDGQVPVPVPLPEADVTLASGAGDHTLMDAGGKVYACGLGEYGELGDGGTSEHQVPTAVVGLPAGRVVALTSSWQGSGALLANGSYYDWGYNQEGQMGDGSDINVTVPVHVALPGPVAQVWQGGSNPTNGQTVALLDNGTVWTWGAGYWGQMGNMTRKGSRVPLRLKARHSLRFAQVCSGGDTSYAIDTSGHLWAWGGDLYGQLGNGSVGAPQLTPVRVGISLSQISATATNVAALGLGLGRHR